MIGFSPERPNIFVFSDHVLGDYKLTNTLIAALAAVSWVLLVAHVNQWPQQAQETRIQV